ncbi:DUF6000 family protein [Streptomyces halstedii]|uniref:DUF6000 family protein n=1 Tax=Streptomyces halstedii TaxID=1944 RepID=UPI003460A365
MTETSSGDLFARYCLPGNRYKKLLSGSFMRADRDQAVQFGVAMIDDARRASASELEQLLQGDWREALTACWLIGFARKSEFRPELHKRIMEGQVGRIGKGVAFALARFCELSDAHVFKWYLERALSEPYSRYRIEAPPLTLPSALPQTSRVPCRTASGRALCFDIFRSTSPSLPGTYLQARSSEVTYGIPRTLDTASCT